MYVVSHISKKKSTLNEEGTSKIGVYPNLLMEQGDISYTLLNGTNIYQQERVLVLLFLKL